MKTQTIRILDRLFFRNHGNFAQNDRLAEPVVNLGILNIHKQNTNTNNNS